MKVRKVVVDGAIMVDFEGTYEELKILGARGAIISWGERSETDQRDFLEAVITLEKPVVIIATPDDMPPEEWLKRFKLVCPVIKYDEHVTGDKNRAFAEAQVALATATGSFPDAWVVRP